MFPKKGGAIMTRRQSSVFPFDTKNE